MNPVQPSFGDLEYSMRRRITRRQEFLDMMDEVIAWDEWTGLIRPHYFNNTRGRRPVPLETMLRMYLLQVWFNLSDEGVEDQINDSYAMRRFMKLDFASRQVPDATTLLHFRHLLEDNGLGKTLFDALSRFFDEHGFIMRGGTVIDATIISAPSSTKNATASRDPQAHQTRKGNQWFFGFKAHTGVDAGTGIVHTVTLTAANVHDLDQGAALIRDDDHVVYADAGYLGIASREDIANDPHLSTVEYRIAARPGQIKKMHLNEQRIESRKASVRAKVEHPYLIVKRDFGFAKTRYRGIVKNLNRLHIAFACANLLALARAGTIPRPAVA
jgi:IS5 family transposase